MTLRTYAIDNDDPQNDPFDHFYAIRFVEADPSVMDPMLAAFQTAWPRTDYPGQERVLFIADQVSWQAGKPKTIREWISELNWTEDTSDIAAAEEFRRLALAVETLGPGSRKRLQDLNFRLRMP